MGADSEFSAPNVPRVLTARGLSKALLQAIASLTVQAGMKSEAPDATKGRSIQIVQALEDAISGITQQRFAFFVTGYQEPKLW